MAKISVRGLAECAIMLAIATILSFIPVYQLPFGGAVTLCSMTPILFLSFRYPVKWSLLTALAFAIIQMLIAFYPPPAQTPLAFAGVVLLDYLVAFGVLGLAGFLARPFGGVKGVLIGGSLAIFVRFLCHFISGIVIWGAYAPEGQSVALYSFLYNGSYMLGEWILTMVALLVLTKLPIPNKMGA